MQNLWKHNSLVTDILYAHHYIVKATEQLQHNSFYQKLNVGPTAKHSEIFNSVIGSLTKQKLLSNSTASKFTVD